MVRKTKKCKCGCGQEGYLWSHGCLKGHYGKQKAIPKVTARQRERIKSRTEYYREAIQAFSIKWGAVFCENCLTPIESPTGSNVSHILAGSNAPHLYLNPLNHKILCFSCERQWSTGDRKSMAIWPDCEKIIQQLKKA